MTKSAEVTDAQEIDAVIAWRIHVLRQAGYPLETAFMFAERSDIDLHTALDLIEAGCDVKTAIRILK